MTQFKTLIVGAIAIAGVATSLVIQQRTHVKLREKEDALRQQDSQLAELTAEHRRLSNLVVQATNSPTNDQMIELQKLRSGAEALRKQTDELGKQLAENRRSRPSQAAAKEDPHPPEYYEQ